MTAQVPRLNQAARNTADGISLVRTAEGALGQINGRGRYSVFRQKLGEI